MMDRSDARLEGRHPGTVEEWLFAAWTSDASIGVLSGHRIVAGTAWYWAAVVREGRDLLHVTDFDIPVRADPFIAKGEALWAEHHCDAPLEQWSIGNETYASALPDPDDALGRAYGTPTPIAFDLEWYATGPISDASDESSVVSGYRQDGVVHGAIEILGESREDLVEVPAARWHRWTDGSEAGALAPVVFPEAIAHTGLRAPFAFPSGLIADLTLIPGGWHSRLRRGV